MRCTSPRTVGFHADGKTLCWSSKHYSQEFATFQLPCGKCLECRLDYARQWAVRCVHESQMYIDNCFVTLTYSDEKLKSPKLQYRDFQLFIKRLRDKHLRDFINSYGKINWSLLSKTQKKELINYNSIGVFVTGEYGDKTKRPHWHACIFNYRPPDATPKYKTDRGHQVYESQILTETWSHGIAEFGDITFDSAGYCARYAAKKLTHGNDDDHQYHPISKKSSKNAIGKKWLEKYWPDVFNYGRIVLPNGETCAIPRYYQKWFQKYHPEKWEHYVTQTKQKQITDAQENAKKNEIAPRGPTRPVQLTRNQVRAKIKKEKFKKLQEHLKL